MTTPQITALPTPPSRTDPSNFSTRADSFLGAIPTFATETNNLATYLNNLTVEFVGDNLSATSSTSFTLDSSAKTLTIETNKAFSAGMLIKVTDTTDSTKYLICTVTSYDKITGVLVASVNLIEGTGTVSTSSISLSAPVQSGVSTGDVVMTNRNLSAPAYLQTDGAIYSQASYSALYTELGLIKDGLNKHFLPAALTTQATPNATEYAPEGFKEWPLASFGSYALLYTKATGAANHKFARTTDGGATWTDITLPTTATDANYTRVVSHDGGTTLVAAHSSTNAWVAQSSDGGLTWNTRTVTGFAGNGQLFVLNGVYILLANNASSMWKSTDGITWSGHITPANLTCKAVLTYQGSQVAIAITSSGSTWTTLYTSSADGTTWTSRTVPSLSTNWGSYNHLIASTNDVFIWMGYYTAYGDYLRSADGGVTWTMKSLPRSSVMTIYPYSPLQRFDGRFFTAIAQGGGGYTLISSADGLTWDLKVTPISVDTEVHAAFHKVVGGSLYLLDGITNATSLYRLDSWKSAWAESHLGHYNGTFAPWYIQQLCETANVQLTLSYFNVAAANTYQCAYRRPLYTYDTATQFAVPLVPATPGVTSYIKA